MAVSYGSPAREAGLIAGAAAWVDVSHLGKLELQGDLARLSAPCAELTDREPELGRARPGPVARQPGIVVREAQHRFLTLFGWAVAEYLWIQVQDAVVRLGGGPAGVDALAPIDEPPEEISRRA